MKKIYLFLSLVLIISISQRVLGQTKQVHFLSKDSVEIIGDLYITSEKEQPFVILFHQATSSRGEYNEIAPVLNTLGLNCLAVDLRSGYSINGVLNETGKNAKKAKMPYRFIDTIQDIESAISYVKANYNYSKLILWGSSYSASLVLKIASYKDVDAVLSFSPGEYFKNEGKPHDFITKTVHQIKCPVFITSKKNEKDSWWPLYQKIESKKHYFIPDDIGHHGSIALWSTKDGNQKYWEAVKDFLKSIEP